ncbi:MAG: hypothetical protein HY317_06235 [Acidobacteria bacterium]|nr:hypothetical protein [Acidobacteriota bacterium]
MTGGTGPWPHEDRLPDAACAAVLLALLAAYWAGVPRQLAHPEEDAAMLLRYSVHLAEGHGIAWNVGEPPLDGATDFLFMLAVAAVHRLGAGVEAAARGVGLAAHALTVLGVFLAIRLLHGAGRGAALLSAAYVALGPAWRYAAVCYGTPLFALATLAGCVAASSALEGERPATRGRWLGLAAVLMGMARPEGALLGVFFLGAVLLLRRGDRVAVLGGFASVFLTLGLAYFAWRWAHFGHPLPNPFYRKGGFVLHWDVLEKAFRNVAVLGGPFLAVLVAGLAAFDARRAALFGLLPVVAFGALWILISDETNYFMRFRYPIVPAILVAWLPAGRALLDAPLAARVRARVPSGAWTALALAASAVLLVAQFREYRKIRSRPLGLYDVAVMLSEYRDEGYTLVTSEAGLLPLYSGWRAVDAWGLNDAWIARNGVVTEEYLDRYRPEVVAFHAPFSPALPPEKAGAAERGLGREWLRMVLVLKGYAERRGYRLAAAFGRNPYDAHYYYVRPGFPDGDAIFQRIRETRYAGAPINYAAPD